MSVDDGSTETTQSALELPSYETLGVRVHVLQIPDVVATMKSWISANDGCHYVAVTGMHGVTEAQSDARFKDVLNNADLVVPDGMPLVWLARINGWRLKRRVYGPELMQTFLEQTGGVYRHFLYGGAPGVADELATVLKARFGTQIAGTYCPPFRSLTVEENNDIVRRISQSRADVIWVGLSTPKQEQWMDDNRPHLTAPVAVGVGAAFDFLAGRKPSAPRWMKEHGLEWLYRLLREPRRLWRRYLIGGARFFFWEILEQTGLRKYSR